MEVKVIVHEPDEGGFWGEVPAIPACASQGGTIDELMRDLQGAIRGCLTADIDDIRAREEWQGPHLIHCRVKPVSGKEFCVILEKHE